MLEYENCDDLQITRDDTGRLIYFLPRDAMLARYMLSSCVRLSVCPIIYPSVCHKPALYQNG